MSFARAYLLRQIPRLGFLRWNVLALRAPLILGNTATLMLQPSAQFVRRYRVPREVMHQAYRDNPVFAAIRRDSLAKTRQLCRELGLLERPYRWLWQGLRILDA